MTEHDSLIAPNLASLFELAAQRWGNRPAFSTRDSSGLFHAVTYRQWYQRSVALATAMIELGVEARNHVAILSDNRFEWILADAAIQLCGATDIPRGADITVDEMIYILNHSDSEVVFIENENLLSKIESSWRNLPKLRHLILLSSSRYDHKVSGNLHFLDALEKQGEALRLHGDRRVEERISKILPDDLFTIIYTSGTTGVPKGVQLTHAAMASQIHNLPLAMTPKDRALSILPIWHSYERVFEMISIASGVHTYYTSLRFISKDLEFVKPTIMASTPRLWEILYQRILAHLKNSPFIFRLLFRLARASMHEVREAHAFFTKQKLDLYGRRFIQTSCLLIRYAIIWIICILPALLLDRIVLAKMRNVVGGRFLGTISGGGALSAHIDTFFNDLGIPVLEGYGLTETCPVIAVRRWDRLVIGTVGPILPETEVRIIDPVNERLIYPDYTRSDLGRGQCGEIYVRGSQVMKGYYKDPLETARILKEGWLATGDLGMMTFNDCLKIVGRCKETIVLTSGENVEPLPIESKLLESPLFDQCMVVGQDQKHLGLLVVPSLEGFAAAGLLKSDLVALGECLKAKEMLRLEIRSLIGKATGFKTFERIATFFILKKSFEVGDELTMTFKLRRNVIAEKYAQEINFMFAS